MTTEPETTTPPAADGADCGGDNNKKKKEKRVIVTPPCPSSVATAYVLLRGVLLGIVGANRNDVTVNVFQPTYIKDKELTGKFSVTLGKKLGCGALELPTSPESIQQFYNAIEKALKRILAGATTTTCLQTTKKAAVEAYSESVLDSNHKKLKDDQQVLLVYMDNLVLSYVPNSGNLENNGISALDKIQSIKLDRGNLGCKISAGPKAKKAEVILKFTVEEKSDEVPLLPMTNTETPLDVVSSEALKPLETTEIRFEEGQELLQTSTATETAAKEETTTTTTQAAEATTETKKDEATTAEEEKMVVNAHEVSGKIDYSKLVDEFGSTLINDALLEKLKKLTAGRVDKLHRFLRRSIFFSHRDLDKLLNQLELNNGTLYLYTGRGPSSDAMHMGHLIPFLFTKWLQEALDVPLVIQMTDDEKFLWKGSYDETVGEYNLQHYQNLTISNAKDIIACGFNYEKTFIFSDVDYVGRMYPNIVKIWRAVTSNVVKNIFGFDGSSNIGQFAFPAIQAAPSFASSFPIVLEQAAKKNDNVMCLIPCAIDQDPYFRMTRDIAHKLVKNDKQHGLAGKPALIHSKFFPPLQGSMGKMSSSNTNSAIFLTDTPEEISKKIKEHAYSGGQDTKKLQQELGANLEEDVAYQWLKFFLEDDDELEAIGKDYSTGSGKYWSTGMVKQRLIEVVQELVAEHQARRKEVTDEEVQKWMTERNIA